MRPHFNAWWFIAALLVALPLLAPTRASAQGLTAGVEGGLNVSKVSIEESGISVSTSSKAGAILGGFVGVDYPKGGVIVEALFSQEGGKFKFADGGESVEFDARVSYIQFPVLGRVNLRSVSGHVVRLFAGPAVAFKTGSSAKATIRSGGTTITEEDDDEDNLKSTAFGIVFGGQVDIRNFFVGARYTAGLTDISDESGSDEPALKGRTFSVIVGVKLK